VKIEGVKLNRKFNLGNYETLDVGFEAYIVETDNPLDVLKGLEDMAELYLQSRTMRTSVAEAIKPKTEPPLEKGVIIDLETLVWQEMPATDKGAWQKSATRNASYYAAKKAIEEKDGKPTYMEGYIVWLNSDGALGRRKK